jgi:hypothetical protein
MQSVKRNNTSSQSGCLLGMGLLFVLLASLGALFVLPGLHGVYTLANLLAPDNRGMLFGGAIFGLSFLLVGVIMTAAGGFGLLSRARLAPPQVSLSTQSPRVGEVVTLTYQQTFRAATDVQIIHMQLILRERATYQRGTETVTVHYDNVAQDYQMPGRHFNSGEGFSDQRQFRPMGMHTFIASKNKLEWLITVRVEMAGWPAYVEEFPLQVAPELAR